MKTLFFSYLLPTSIAIILFYAGYYFLLRKGSFFQLNRLFLLLALGFSFALPFIHFENPAPIRQINYIAVSEQIIHASTSDITIMTTSEKSFDWSSFFKTIYLAGIAFMLLRILAQLGRILVLVNKFGIKRENRYSIIWMQNNLPHFSFFGLIFLNQNKFKKKDEISIILHEAAHSKQCHFVDLLLLEIATTFQWFNPVMWLYKRSLKSVHEYLADQAVLKTVTEKVEYYKLLVHQTTGFHLESLTNSFYYPSLKNRIRMMTKKQNNRKNLLKLCLALPLFVLLIYIFAYANTEQTSGDFQSKFNSEEYKTTPDKPAAYKNGEKDILGYFLSAFDKDWQPKIIDKTTVIVTLYIDESGKVVSAYTEWNYLWEDKEIDFNSWFTKMGSWKPAIKNEKPIKSTYVFDGSNALMEEAKRRCLKIYTVEEFNKEMEDDNKKAEKENPFNTIPDQPAVCKGGEKMIIQYFFSAIDFSKWKSEITDKTTMRYHLSIDETGKVTNVGAHYNTIGLFANTKDEFDFSKAFTKMDNWQPAIKDGKPVKSTYIFDGADILRSELKKRGLKIYTVKEFMEKPERVEGERNQKMREYRITPDQLAKFKNGERDLDAYFISKIDFKKFKSKITNKSICEYTFYINEQGEIVTVDETFINQGNYIDLDFRIGFEKMGNWQPATKNGKPVKSMYIYDGGDVLRKAMKEKGIKVYTIEEFLQQ